MDLKSLEYLRKSLMMQLTVIVMAVTAIVLTGSGVYQYKKDASALENSLREELKHVADYCATSVAVPIFNFDDSTIVSICLAIMGRKEIVGIGVDKGNDMWMYFARNEHGSVVQVDALPEYANCLKTTRSIMYKGIEIGQLYIVITRSYIKDSLFSVMKVNIATIFVLEVLLVFLLLFLLRFRFVLPLKHLARVASRISRGDFEHSIDIYGSNELSTLASDISLMRDSIKQKFDELKNQVAVREDAEARLENLGNYLANIIDSMPSILVGVDKDYVVTQWNLWAHRETGLDSTEAVGRPLELVFPRLWKKMERVRDAMQLREVQIDHRCARDDRGECLYEDITIYPLKESGFEGAVIRVDDVTEQVRIEEMIVQSEKMLSVGGLAAGMAHEINNPLAGMMQTANVMASRLGGEPETLANIKAAMAAGTTMEAIRNFMEARDIPRMINTIKESGQRVADIVGNMLSFARKSDAQVSSHALSDLFDKSLELAATDYDLKKHYDFKTIEIIKEYEENLPLIPCEETKIQQVFLNILLNGAQAMQESGVEKPRFIVRIRFEKEAKKICMEIEDNGSGMDRKILKRVFEPFFTTKPVGVGTGLGLSVSYFIITENHGGEMAVDSVPGVGSKFIIRLPIERKYL